MKLGSGGKLGQKTARLVPLALVAATAVLFVGQSALVLPILKGYGRLAGVGLGPLFLLYFVGSLSLAALTVLAVAWILLRQLVKWTVPVITLTHTVERLVRGELHKPVVLPPSRKQTELERLFAGVETLRTLLYKQLHSALSTPRLDGLTNTWDRLYFNEKLALEVRDGAVNARHRFCILLSDVDYLKAVNDTFGFREGDRVLREVAMQIQQQIRTGDVLARFGGEEFALIAYMDLPRALDYAEHIRRAARFVTVQGQRISISIGIAEYKQGETPEVLIKRAETALYQSKQSGRNCVRYSA